MPALPELHEEVRVSRLLDPKFKYVPAAQTDVRVTIERERRRLAAEARKKKRAERLQAAQQATNDAEAAAKVRPLAARRKP